MVVGGSKGRGDKGRSDGQWLLDYMVWGNGEVMEREVLILCVCVCVITIRHKMRFPTQIAMSFPITKLPNLPGSYSIGKI